MKNLWLWVVFGGLLYLVYKKGGLNLGGSARASTAVPNRTTSPPAQPFWQGWDFNTAQGLRNTTGTISDQAASTAAAITTGFNALRTVWGAFYPGGASRGTASASSPTSTGSGVGTPGTGQPNPGEDVFGSGGGWDTSGGYGEEYNPGSSYGGGDGYDPENGAG